MLKGLPLRHSLGDKEPVGFFSDLRQWNNMCPYDNRRKGTKAILSHRVDVLYTYGFVSTQYQRPSVYQDRHTL